MSRKLGEKKTRLEHEALNLALWILRAVIYLRNVLGYLPREQSRVHDLISPYIKTTTSLVTNNFILAMLAVRTGRHDSCGGNIHLAVVGVGPVFDFYTIEQIRFEGYKEMSDSFVRGFLLNSDEPEPYFGNIHVHPIRYEKNITIRDILEHMRKDHGPNNGLFNKNCEVYFLELVFGKPVRWQLCTNADLARICAASIKTSGFLFGHKFSGILNLMKKYTFILFAAAMLLAAGCTKSTTDTSLQNNEAQPAIPVVGESVTMAKVAEANSESNCWTVVNGSVYNLTEWIKQHPGGKSAILGICGKDGTVAFSGQHNGQPQPQEALAGFKIGTIAN